MTTEARNEVRKEKDPAYLMGRTEAETRRLMAVSNLYASFTRWLLEDAGIEEGMSVLDVGTGPGDVALLVAEMVGAQGSVVGMDQNPEVLKTARARAEGLRNVRFVAGDLRDEVPCGRPGGAFDAVVGRLVLMYLSDPADALRGLADRLKPGGIVAFQDYNLSGGSLVACPPTPLWQESWGWVRGAARGAGIQERMGYGLRRVFLDAGLPEPKMRLESAVGGGPDSALYHLMAETVRSVLPLVVKLGIATEEEVGVDTLARRLRAETVASDGVIKGPDLVSAWARKSG